MIIETIEGTMKAEAWHVGKMVAADPSGFNWRIEDAEIDQLIELLESSGTSQFRGERQLVMVSNNEKTVIINAKDTAFRGSGTRTVLTSNGRNQFLEILKSVVDRPLWKDRYNWHLD